MRTRDRALIGKTLAMALALCALLALAYANPVAARTHRSYEWTYPMLYPSQP